MAIMQSTTTQTDLLTGFWLVCYAYFIFGYERYSKIDLFWIAASFSLAILTKPTALIFGIPLSFVAAYRIIKFQLDNQKSYFRAWIQSILNLIVLGFTCLSLSLPSYWRNYHTFGSFLGIDTGTRSEAFGITYFISTFLKNILINFPISFLREFISSIHDHILSLSIDAPEINFSGMNIMTENLVKLLSPHEDFVASPLHYLLFCLGFITIVINYFKLTTNQPRQDLHINKNKINSLLLISLCVLVGFILFSILLKWQIWHNRLLLPLVILGTPVMTYYVRNTLNLNWQKFVALLLALVAIIYSLTPMRHPLVSLPIISETQLKEQSASIVLINRKNIYFSGAKKGLEIPYQEAVNAITKYHCHSIGLAFREDDWEYPLWILLKNNLQKHFQIKHINVQNKSQKLEPEFADSQICAVISTIPAYDIRDLNSSKQWQKLIILEELPESYLAVYLVKQS